MNKPLTVYSKIYLSLIGAGLLGLTLFVFGVAQTNYALILPGVAIFVLSIVVFFFALTSQVLPESWMQDQYRKNEELSIKKSSA